VEEMAFLFQDGEGMPYSKIMLVAVLVGIILFAGGPAGAQENEEAITALAWSSDATRVAVGYLGGQIEVISADGQSHQVLQKASGRRVNELAWHPDGNLLASGSDHGNVQIWDTTVGSYTEFSAEYPLDCVGLLWSYDGSRLLAISSQREPNLFIWQAETGELISSASVGSLYDPHWNRDNTFLIAGNASTVLALVSTGDRIVGTPIGEPTFPTVIGEQMFTAAWSPDETRVAGGTPSGHVRVWDVNTKQLVMDVGGENYDVSTWQMSLIVELAFTPDGRRIQALDGSGMFRGWDVASAELLTEEQLPVTGTPIFATAFSPNETAIAYGGEDGELSITQVPANPVVGQAPETIPVTLAPIPTETGVTYGDGVGVAPEQPDESISPKAQALRDMLTSCDHASFEGIELDTSTKADVSNIFDTLGISPDIQDYGSSTIWWWTSEDAQLLAVDEIHPKVGFITFHGEVVRQVTFMLDPIELATVVEAFGAPDAVIEVRSTNGSGIVIYRFVYRDKRLIFSTNSQYMINNVVLVSAKFKDNQIDALLAVNSSQPCADYGTPPCLVPTATPPAAP
jgi:hypothetical protein